MTRLDHRLAPQAGRPPWGPRLLRLVALVAVGACGGKDPQKVDAGTGGTGGTTGGTGGTSTGGSGGSPTGGTGGGGTGGTAGTAGTGGTGGGGSTDAPPAMAYFPFAVGNRWTYDILEPGVAVYRKEQVVVRMEAVGGNGPHKALQAFRVETRKYGTGGSTTLEDATISWQLRDGNKVVRYRETSCNRFSAMLMNDAVTGCTIDVEDYWNPPRLRLDERPNGQDPANGVTWPETYMEFKNTYDWAVANPPGSR